MLISYFYVMNTTYHETESTMTIHLKYKIVLLYIELIIIHSVEYRIIFSL